MRVHYGELSRRSLEPVEPLQLEVKEIDESDRVEGTDGDGAAERMQKCQRNVFEPEMTVYWQEPCN